MANKLTISDLKSRNLLLFECISGSKAYGTNLPGSDTDLKGVFILPEDDFYGLDYVDQVSSEKNDEVYYELKRFAELLYQSNPGILEMLGSPPDCILFCDPLFEGFLQENFLSKRCKETFAGFAFAQIKKARGLNKKINQPLAPERKTPLDFCYVPVNQGSIPVEQWLQDQQLQQARCGLVPVPNMRDLFALFYDESGTLGFSGILKKENANEVALSSVPKGMEPLTLMSFNKDGYSIHCRQYREYQDWLLNRNEERYQNTLEHGKNYDAKNMMHTIRLLEMAAEIMGEGKIQVRRPNRDDLLLIRKGEYPYEALIARAEQKLEEIEILAAKCALPEQPDKQLIQRMLASVRKRWYGRG
jgi:uncharacterized protein